MKFFEGPYIPDSSMVRVNIAPLMRINEDYYLLSDKQSDKNDIL